MECEKPHAALATEYNPMDAINARVRPMRSAIHPNNNPLIAEASNVREFRKPAVRVSIANSRIRNASTREYNITSMASSIQPRPPATSVWRCAAVVSRGQLKSRAGVGFAEGIRVGGSASAMRRNSWQRDRHPQERRPEL